MNLSVNGETSLLIASAFPLPIDFSFPFHLLCVFPHLNFSNPLKKMETGELGAVTFTPLLLALASVSRAEGELTVRG